ncbi:nuclear transport factor 2 family protein [Agarivorans sp. Z349TD_8]|uniref:nuclear transport factor 2 family protein n=1 Tax=Agarivorans sp. Z349TD_8 TaxID=3421434 RepID=UPI003D7D136B
MKTETIIDYESRLKEAMLDSNVVVLNELLSEELVFTNHFGQLMSKSDDIEGHRSGFVNINSIKLSDQTVKVFGDTVVVSVLSLIEGTFGDAQANALFRFTRIWKKIESGKWQVIAAHSTAISDAST